MKLKMESLFVKNDCAIREDLDQLINSATPQIELQTTELRDCVQIAISKLNSRDRAVLKLKFGFESEPCTYEEIGKRMNICKQRVGQIAQKAETNVRKIVNQLTNSKNGNDL